MNGQSNLDRTEIAVRKLAEENVKLAESVRVIGDKLQALADSQKHTDSNIEALTEIIRQFIERKGNGAAGH